ncbi:SpoIIE family protein phosphatase [Streptomyces sp. NBC_00237]|uniref:PP2C family protein-serine/threonine phosphatase n=1 Tax=Streptomyces sp. NBC_00237 TaxID=2975687 RepID=UPI002252CD2D|nr:SpoIIE family protein phosphatase [Streptomyces sp. NBC_00237]MCX5205481.1 SpoIIE family protein phosphatase [Streptomyces sp. NBC_00237]
MTDRDELGEAPPSGEGCGDVDGTPVLSTSHYVVPRRPVGDDGQSLAVSVSAVQEVLNALPGSATFLMPVYGPDSAVVDFRVVAASPDAVDIGGRRGKEMVGLSVLETYPTVADSDVWRGYLAVLEGGGRYDGEPFEYEEALAGIPRRSRFAVRAAACHGGLIVSWVRLDTGEREQRRLAVMQRLGGMGWADWDLVLNEITWSDEVFAVFGRDRALGPMTLEELSSQALPEDRPGVGETVRQLLSGGDPVDHSFRITTPDGELRHVRIVAEAELDVDDVPVEVHGFFQDRTGLNRAAQEVLEHQQAASAQRSLLAAEKDLAARLQHALLPLPQQSLRLSGLTVDVAYHPLQEGLNVGGDWYSAIELPDGSALLVVGDVAGHGLDAVATMAQLRFTAKAMAITGTPLPEILTRLNTLLLHTAGRNYGTATMIMGRYDPATARLTWVQAGHLPPLLLREGQPRYLPVPRGILLGAMAAPVYEEATLQLLPGDHLLLFTDGLVEVPGRDVYEGLARLARSAADHAGDTRILDALVGPDSRHDDTCALHVAL